MIYAQVIIDISSEELDRPFTYSVPETLEDELRPGMMVRVPFGSADRLRKAFLVGFTRTTDLPAGRIKQVHSVLTGSETTEGRLISLAGWLKETYGCTMAQALRTVFPVKGRVKTVTRQLLIRKVSPEEIREAAEKLSPARYRARIRILSALEEQECLDVRYAQEKLGLTASVTDFLRKEGLAELESREKYRSPLRQEVKKDPERPVLTQSQARALDRILEEWTGERARHRPVLLQGVTGSGKTLIYMELIRRTLEAGKQVIVLIPEIALTWQTVRRFYARFGENVSVVNSRLSAGERYDQFRLAKEGKVRIMVGPRSALFTPFPDPGLIIVDEEHESSYLSEHSPRYHAVETAVYLAQSTGARLLLGSATPSLESYYRARMGEYLPVSLCERFQDRPMPEVQIVDMRQELKRGNRLPVSRTLARELDECLSAGQQAMIFLNRRGFAGFVSCRSCGAVVKCPHCDVSLTEHNGGRLICHYCGYESVKIETCRVCGSPSVGGFKAGTQQIEKALHQLFPQASILRMDYDTTRKKGSYEDILQRFAGHEADILVGTQMIVKGHDFPDVTLVGAVAADLSLNSSDFRCAERTFQLLVQAAGRAGRGKKRGKAVFQTYQPEHYSIRAAAVQDYERFYAEEISFRMLMGYPPAGSMMTVLGSGADEEQLQKAMTAIHHFILRIWPEAGPHLLGPAPAAVGKIKDVWHMALYLKYPGRERLRMIREKVEQYIEINPGFQGMTVQYEMQ